MNTTWENLSKSALDPTLIEQAIDDKINDHNDDIDAHLGAGKSLESHRAAEVIDHLAESVVNDKIQRAARAYVAVVGSGADGDFNTIQDAIDYAAPLGGGNILIRPGTYYLSGAVELPLSCNLIGVDPESCIISTNYAGGNYLVTTPDTVSGQTNLSIENLTLHVPNGYGITYISVENIPNSKFIANNCRFTGGGTYIDTWLTDYLIENCNIIIGAISAFESMPTSIFRQCIIECANVAADANILGLDGDNETDMDIRLIDCVVNNQYGRKMPIVSSAFVNYISLQFCRIYNIDNSVGNFNLYFAVGNQISLNGSNIFELKSQNAGTVFIGNIILGGAANNFKVSINEAVVVGNKYKGIVNNTGANNTITANGLLDDIETLPTATTALALASRRVTYLTPNSSRTLTTTVPQAGEERILIILTSGTSSYTMTFGTGFKAVGTLATGTTSARRFVMRFVSDGTYMLETGRTAAIA